MKGTTANQLEKTKQSDSQQKNGKGREKVIQRGEIKR